MVIPLAEAQGIDPNATQAQLDAYEASVRQLTANNFHVRGAVIVGIGLDTDPTRLIIDRASLGFDIKTGDTLELVGADVNNGLFEVLAIDLDTVYLTLECRGEIRAKGEYNKAQLFLVRYPADIKGCVRGLIEYDKYMKGKRGVKSETISRMSLTYYDVNASENVDGYPAALLGSLKKWRKVRWG
jgi:hypothetical protein